jgi:hypothetical protein
MSNFREIQKIVKRLGLIEPSKYDTDYTVPTASEVDFKYYMENTSMYKF